MMYSMNHLKNIFLSLIFLTLFSTNLMAQTGIASWYGGNFHGRRTASGEIFNTNKFMAAHKTLKFGTKVRVTNLNNNKSVIVIISDRGPFVRGRIIDLSHAAKSYLGMGGTAKVNLEIIK